MAIEGNKAKWETAARTLAHSRPQGQSVLLVEPDPDLQWSVARMLTVSGNQVIGTSSAEGALAVVEQWIPDVALVATDLPGTTGVQIARRLRALKPDLLVILMGEPTPEPQPKPRRSDVSAYLAKPFRFESLRALIESLQLTPAPAE